MNTNKKTTVTYRQPEEIKPFMTITETRKTFGLSDRYLRRGCWDGSVPHIRSGNRYMIDTAELLAQLHDQAHNG